MSLLPEKLQLLGVSVRPPTTNFSSVHFWRSRTTANSTHQLTAVKCGNGIKLSEVEDKSAASKRGFLICIFSVCFCVEKAPRWLTSPPPPALTAEAYRLPTPPKAEALQTGRCAARDWEFGCFVLVRRCRRRRLEGLMCVCVCVCRQEGFVLILTGRRKA